MYTRRVQKSSNYKTVYTLNSHSLVMTVRHKAFIKIMKFVRDLLLSVYTILNIQT